MERENVIIYITDTGDETKLNELQIAITPRADCGNMWGSNYILNTHVCVGDGEIGSCNVC